MNIKEVSPCYIYEEKVILEASKQLKQHLPGFEVLYSIKTNPFPPVVRTLQKEGFGADAASFHEVQESIACGMAKEDIYYSAPGKKEKEIRYALGQCVLVADSLHEIQLIQKVAEEERVVEKIGIRVHPQFTMGGSPISPSKFGIDLEQLSQLKQVLNECPNIQVVGVHVHLRSQELNADVIGQYYKDVMDMVISLKEECDLTIEFINFGSGIGTVYDHVKESPVDLEKLQTYTQELVQKNEELHARLLIESGRFLVCHAGTYFTPVLDKKQSHGITYLVVPNGMNSFLRPAIASLVQKVAKGQPVPGMEPLYTNDHEFDIRVVNENDTQETVTVVGNLCTALDVICENVTMNQAEIGDLIEISNAGSYAFSLSPQFFSSHNIPNQFLHTVDGEWVEE